MTMHEITIIAMPKRVAMIPGASGGESLNPYMAWQNTPIRKMKSPPANTKAINTGSPILITQVVHEEEADDTKCANNPHDKAEKV